MARYLPAERTSLRLGAESGQGPGSSRRTQCHRDAAARAATGGGWQGMTRTGRRPGNDDTRGVILSAARARFAAHGYRGAIIRGIAMEADVDPALVHHYFGTKRSCSSKAFSFPSTPPES